MDEGGAAPMEEEDMAEVEKHRAARAAEAAALAAEQFADTSAHASVGLGMPPDALAHSLHGGLTLAGRGSGAVAGAAVLQGLHGGRGVQDDHEDMDDSYGVGTAFRSPGAGAGPGVARMAAGVGSITPRLASLDESLQVHQMAEEAGASAAYLDDSVAAISNDLDDIEEQMDALHEMQSSRHNSDARWLECMMQAVQTRLVGPQPGVPQAPGPFFPSRVTS